MIDAREVESLERSVSEVLHMIGVFELNAHLSLISRGVHLSYESSVTINAEQVYTILCIPMSMAVEV